MTLKLTLAASLVALGLLTGTAYAATGVATGAVNIRDQPGVHGDIVGQLAKGEEVEIAKCAGGWCLTEEGYVSASYLALADGDEDEDEDEEEDEEEDEDEEDYEEDEYYDDDTPQVKFHIGY